MKHLIDYIEECGEGCSTPGNTVGMGNPMPPTEEAHGSEPLCGKCKKEKKKKKVTESILDSDENQKNFDKNVMTAWLKKVVGKDFFDKYVAVSDDGEVTCQKRYLPIELYDGETIPEWIKCNIDSIVIDTNADIIIPKNFLLDTMQELEISTSGNKIKFDAIDLYIGRCVIRGEATDVIFPRNFKCKDLSMSECRSLTKVENISHIKKINFPSIFGANLIRQATKFKGEIQMNGFGPY